MLRVRAEGEFQGAEINRSRVGVPVTRLVSISSFTDRACCARGPEKANSGTLETARFSREKRRPNGQGFVDGDARRSGTWPELWNAVRLPPAACRNRLPVPVHLV